MIIWILIAWQVIGFAVEAVSIPLMLIRCLHRPHPDFHLERAAENAWEATEKAVKSEKSRDSVAPPDMAEFYVTMSEAVNLRKRTM